MFRRIWLFLKFLSVWLRFIAVLVVTALVVGYWDHVQNYYERWQRTHQTQIKASAHDHAEKTAEGETEYFCPMHTFVVRDQPGKCPICGMTLVPRKKGAAAQLPEGVIGRVQASPERIMQNGVKVEPVAYRSLARTVRLYGTIEPDETRLARIIARFPGRVDEVMVNATGSEVKKGDALVRIYSPKYLAATEEYAQALTAQKHAEADSKNSPDSKQLAAELVKLARQRLSLAGYTDAQLDEIAKSETPEHFVKLFSPLAGTVIEKSVLLGEMVEEGTALYTVADLSTLWIQAQVPESDIQAVKKGTPAEVATVSLPGETFYGTVDFIYPSLNAESRTVRARVVVPNGEGKLKPGMFVTATLSSPLGQFGAIGSSEEPQGQVETGKEIYTCPMHPEVVSDKPGDCPKCNMALEKKKVGDDASRWTEGYTCPMHPDHLESEPGSCKICDCKMELKKYRVERILSVPEEAVIDTGARQIVYVESSPGVFDARAVTLGPRSGIYFPVLKGLEIGDRIVGRGAFLIDAENRLNPGIQSAAPQEHHHAGM